MSQPWPAPIAAIVADHSQAWEGLAHALRDLTHLPVKTGVRLLTGDNRPTLSPQALSDRTIQALQEELNQTHKALQSLLQRCQQAQEDYALELARWKVENERLKGEGSLRLNHMLEDQKRQFLAWAEPTFLQVPLVEYALAQGNQMPAADVLLLFRPFEAALSAWGVELIGKVGQTLPYNAAHHETPGHAPVEGSPIVIRQPGYRLNERVIRRAQVRAVDA